jgi:hypothetical protein
VPAAVYVDMSNAYWDGEGVAFGRGDGIDFDDFGLYAEVIYHEYTHGVTDKIYAGIEFPYFAESGAMNEGWSDYFGCALSISQSPLVGENGLVIYEPNGFRTLNNNYRRETDWFNEVHVDSQMFSSSLWQARQAVGPEAMDELVHFARYAHATTFEDYLLALLLEDDCRYGDGDLSNGTSHGQDIFTAFGNHGIGGLQYQASSIVVNEQTGNGDGKLDPGETAELSLTLSNGWADANNITATLECNDPLVTIHEANAAFDDANYGETTNNSADSFIISVADDCPDTHTINFTLTISADGPYRYSRTCLLYYNVAPRQLAYDDGAADESIGYGGAGGVLAVRVTPDTYPCYPTHVRLFPYTKTTTTVAVWDDDANGLPGTLLGTVTARPRILGDWYDVDISQLGLTIDSGSIYVGWIEGAFFLNGFDYDPPYYQRSWVSDGAEWNPLEYYGYLGNFMIRLRYSEEPPFHIKLPYDYALCPGQPVSFCLQAVNGTSPYDDWTALPQPDYNYSIAGSSSFAERGTGKGWQDDDASFAYDLPFEFQYYGTTYTKVYISTNGFLDFATDSSDYYNSDEELAYNVRIAPLWDDITTYSPGDIFIDESVPGEVAIRWQGETYMYELPVNFDVVLFNDGCIRFDYGFNDIGLSPTVGISAGDAFHYILVPGYNGDPNGLDNVASVLLTPTTPKPSLPADLTLDPATGCLSGTPLNEGEYLVIIEVNDSSSPPKTTKANFIFTIKPPIADFNRDCIVNFDDFASFGSNWLAKSCRASNNWCNGADLDQNKRVDIYDLAIFANLWLDGTTQ